MKTKKSINNQSLFYLTEMINDYQIRLAKILKAAHQIREYNLEKESKLSAATQTKRFIKDLNRLRRRWQPMDIEDEPMDINDEPTR